MIKIELYKDFEKFIQKFKEGYFDLLVIQSRGGLGKTFNANQVLGASVFKINSHMTPLGLYEAAYHNRDRNIWMDDVENLFNNDKTIGICKQLADTQPVKEISYLTSWNMKKSRNVPKAFKTKAKVLITCNAIQRMKNEGILALLTRGITLNFDPLPEEVNRYIKTNFKDIDKDILDFLKETKEYGLRDYIKCHQLKSAGFRNWKELSLGKLRESKN